jgi:uncharacterized protein (DUF779 family)
LRENETPERVIDPLQEPAAWHPAKGATLPSPVRHRGARRRNSEEEDSMPERVLFTPKAAALVAQLKADNGPLIFHLSGGCCEGSAPMCFRRGDFRPGAQDVLLGWVDGCPFYVGASQFQYWAYCEITVDLTEGGGDSFSLEAADGVRFIVRSRLFSDAEVDQLEAAGPPPRGPEAISQVATT